MLNFKDLMARVRDKSTERLIIRPRSSVRVNSAADKQRVAKLARDVISEHRDVLTALKNR